LARCLPRGGRGVRRTPPADDRGAEITKLKGKVGDVTMTNKLLEARVGRARMAG
jgi:hypothetical protein